MSQHVPAGKRHPLLALAPLAAALAVAGCGGGDNGMAPTSFTGNIVKGPVTGAQVCAYQATATGKGAQLGCTTTGVGGSYTLSVGAEGSVVIEATGGTYTDEATGASRTLSDPMQLVVAASAGSNVTGVVTPLTSIAYSLSRSGTAGLSASSFATAINQVATSFSLGSVNLLTAVPVVTPGTADAYGRMLRAVSQYVANGGTLADLQSATSPTRLQAALQAAYLTINGSSITLNLSGLAGTGSTGSTGSTGNTGNTGGTGGTGNTGGGGLTISFSAGGLGGATIPSVNVPGVAAPVPGTFCSGLSSSDPNLAALRAAGTLTISSCTGSGNTYTVNMTVAASGLTIPYTVTYAYN